MHIAGITINGDAPYDIKIHNEKFYNRVARDPELALGETYMDGWWDTNQLELFFDKLIKANIEGKIKTNPRLALKFLLTRFLNYQTKKRSLEVGIKHYDLGNDLFQIMLDSNMTYTCGYWKNAESLEQAQLAKLDLTCKKLGLQPGMRLLDIGCGWGSLAKYAAEHYDVEVVGVTISQQQCELAKERCKNLPIDIRFQDYRDIKEKFDRIASLGMFEHVGYLNYRSYMHIVHDCLKEEGLFLLHTIGSNVTTTHSSPWITKYIFPNSMLPSIAQIGKAAEGLFVMEDWHNFGPDYYKTLLAWHENFNKDWSKIQNNYDKRFFRMWNYYLLYSASGFIGRELQLWQVVFSKNRINHCYETVR